MPGRLHPRRGSSAATPLFIAAIAALMILAAVPVVRHTRAGNHARACVENLAALLAAKERFVLDRDLKAGAPVTFDDLLQTSPTLLGRVPVCPDGGRYSLSPAGTLPACSVPGHALPMAGLQRPIQSSDSSATTATAAR